MTLAWMGVRRQMIFTHDTELTLRAACVLINTNRDDDEDLGDIAALDIYLDSFGWTGRRDRDDAELAAVHRLRRWHAGPGCTSSPHPGSGRSCRRRWCAPCARC